MDYKNSLEYLYSLSRFGMVFGLKNIKDLLDDIGNPDKKLRFIHIAGTNGKGSTAFMIYKILVEAGMNAGIYTSPHLSSFCERIMVADEMIPEKDVANLTDFIRYQIEKKGKPSFFTFFDFTTAMALLYFYQKKADPVILEVGLGGRLDSTNIVSPLISIITNIEKDHQDVLGDSIYDIAKEKAGIIKKNIPVITGETKNNALKVITKKAKQLNAPLYVLGKDFNYKIKAHNIFDYSGIKYKLTDLKISLLGVHQFFNASLALATIEILINKGVKINIYDIYNGIEKSKLNGRLEIVKRKPTIILDVAHNLDGVISLKKSLENGFNWNKLFLIIGIMKDKDIRSIVETISSLADKIIFSQPKIGRAATPKEILQQCEGLPLPFYEISPQIPMAIDKVLKEASLDDLILITGSFYTVGEAREYLLNLPTGKRI